jgi:alkylhydroperoxidase family enzyme
VRLNAVSITDDDVAELKDAGLSEDEIFELTVAAAASAGLDRLHAGLKTLE